MNLDYFYNTPFVKMGRWALWPLDSENWHGEETSKNFQKIFGFGKGTLAIHLVNETLPQNAYFPTWYFEKLYNYITGINAEDYKALEKKLQPFYALKAQAKKEIPAITAADWGALTNDELIDLYKRNRDWAHRVTVFDQFGWIGEEYWSTPMTKILVERTGLTKDSPEYQRVLFILTKPEEISTTLEEKRVVLEHALKVKNGEEALVEGAAILAHDYGWMPVFTFGEAWDVEHYHKDLEEQIKKDTKTLSQEFDELKSYAQIRAGEVAGVLTQYPLAPQDLQIFFDFALALDTRNEAEYLVSLCGYHVRPMYEEMAKRLGLTLTQLRCLYEAEIVEALLGKIDAKQRLQEKGECIGWGFAEDMLTRANFTPEEAKKLYEHLEKNVESLHGHSELKGVCASPGKVVGAAKIMHSPTDEKKVGAGDILITHATTVDYLPAMKRAAAFVTEVGGLTCHAAVVAREFKVPCVVGLKNATVNFMDGEIIEVDASNGVVRKLRP